MSHVTENRLIRLNGPEASEPEFVPQLESAAEKTSSNATEAIDRTSQSRAATRQQAEAIDQSRDQVVIQGLEAEIAAADSTSDASSPSVADVVARLQSGAPPITINGSLQDLSARLVSQGAVSYGALRPDHPGFAEMVGNLEAMLDQTLTRLIRGARERGLEADDTQAWLRQISNTLRRTHAVNPALARRCLDEIQRALARFRFSLDTDFPGRNRFNIVAQ